MIIKVQIYKKIFIAVPVAIYYFELIKFSRSKTRQKGRFFLSSFLCFLAFDDQN